MPNFDIYDVFCFSGPMGALGDNIDLDPATLLDPVTVNTTADSSGDPIIDSGTDFNGETVTTSGPFGGVANLSDGSTLSVSGYYASTDAGNTYIVFDDTEGDMTICSLDITKFGETTGAIGWQDVDSDNDINNCVCFTSDMPIETDRGPIRAGDLKAGDMVKTLDRGFQPLRCIYKREVPAMGAHRPVYFAPGAVGNTEALIVSQKHRIYTGTFPKGLLDRMKNLGDHLVHADNLLNYSTIRLMSEVKTVEYVHLMFDQHELVYCNGSISESWQPTRKALKQAPEMADELLSIFPELATTKAIDPGCMVRAELVFNQPT